MSLHAYLPQDRLQALARGQTLPDHTFGSALFADISGFTPLTEALRDSLGPRRGAEEMTKYLNSLYSELIAQVERFDGSKLDLRPLGLPNTNVFGQTDGWPTIRSNVDVRTAVRGPGSEDLIFG